MQRSDCYKLKITQHGLLPLDCIVAVLPSEHGLSLPTTPGLFVTLLPPIMQALFHLTVFCISLRCRACGIFCYGISQMVIIDTLKVVQAKNRGAG